MLGEAYFPTFVLDMLLSGLPSDLFPDEMLVREDFLLTLTCAGGHREKPVKHTMGGDSIVYVFIPTIMTCVVLYILHCLKVLTTSSSSLDHRH